MTHSGTSSGRYTEDRVPELVDLAQEALVNLRHGELNLLEGQIGKHVIRQTPCKSSAEPKPGFS